MDRCWPHFVFDPEPLWERIDEENALRDEQREFENERWQNGEPFEERNPAWNTK